MNFTNTLRRAHRFFDLVYYAFGYQLQTELPSIFLIETQTSVDNYEKVVDIINREVEELSTVPLAPEELEKYKGEMINQHPLRYQTNTQLAKSHSLYETMGIGWDFQERLLSRILRVAPEEVRETAERYFRNPVMVISRPTGDRVPGYDAPQ